MKHLTDIEQQIMLVAKCHYNHFAPRPSQNGYKIELLRRVIKKHCELDEVPDRDLLELVVPVFIQYASPYAQQDAFRWMFDFGMESKDTVTRKEMILRMLGAIGIIQIVKDGENLFDLDSKKVIDISDVT
jgi:hypothetical protein